MKNYLLLKNAQQLGFTMTELIVVVSIITILTSSVIFGSLRVIERAQATKTVDSLMTIKTAAGVFHSDTGIYPSTISLEDSDDSNSNDLLTDNGIAGWNGPYLEQPLFAHQWKGAIRYLNEADSGLDMDGDGNYTSFFVVLDDDSPGSTSGANDGIIPTIYMDMIDRLIDDGNLTTGLARGNGCGNGVITFYTACNEMAIRIAE